MGDFAANFVRPDAGIHTAEGLVAGSRAAQLERKRQRDQLEFEAKKQHVEQQHSTATVSISDKFTTSRTVTQEETSFKAKTVGLVSAEEFRRLTRQAEQGDGGSHRNQQEPSETTEEREAREKAARKARKKQLKEKQKMMATLSFAGNVEDGDGDSQAELISAKTIIRKDPTVDTSFLPDQQRDLELQKERQRLEKEWKQEQERLKRQPLEIVYSYWDGTGHRRSCKCVQGDTVGSFLDQVRKECSKEFKELSGLSSDDLLYVKEDLILPHDLTFYDLIATKARGKSGPLFHFDVHEDVRVGALDVRVEKDESHPGKVVER